MFSICYEISLTTEINKTIELKIINDTIIENEGYQILEQGLEDTEYLDFQFWSTQKKGFIPFYIDDYSSIVKLKNNITLYGSWQSKKGEITIEFESNGGLERYNIDYDRTIDFIPQTPSMEPKKDGYVFDGWYKDKSLLNKYIFETTREYENFTLYAKWKQVDFFATYVTNSEVNLEKQIIQNGLIQEPQEIIIKGAYIEGWYKDKKYKEKWNFKTDISNSDTTLYSKWISVASTSDSSKWVVDSIKDSFSDNTDSNYIKYEDTIKGTYTSNDISYSPISLTIESYQPYWNSTYIGFIFNAKDRVENEINLINLFKDYCDCKIEIKSDDKIYKSYSVLDTTSLKIELYDNLNFNIFEPIYLEKPIKMVITLFDSNQKAVAKIEIPEFDTTGYANTFKEL